MFEGKELEKSFGDVATVSVDVTPDLHLEVSATVRVDLIGEAKKLAAKTGTPIDDVAIAWLEKLVRAAA
jgi:hypothetical protein